MPKLRFPEFIGEWEDKKLGDVTKITRLAGAEYSSIWETDPDGEIIALRGFNIGENKIFLEGSDRINRKLSQKLIRSKLFKGDVVFPCVGSIGNAAVIKEDNKYHINQNIAKITCENSILPSFLVQLLISNIVKSQILKYNTSSFQPNVLVGNLRLFKIPLTSPKEQKIIASFLSKVDEKIEKLGKKKQLWETYKKGIMQQIFRLELRFKDDNGKEYPDWEYKEAKMIFENYSNKKHEGNLPILAVTQNNGVIDRDLVDIEIKTSSKSVKSYKIVESGNFVISLRSFQGGIEYSELKGIVSPAYTVLKSKIQICDDFYKHYFKKEDFISRLNAAVIGIREGKQISYSVFSEMIIPYPSIEEQEKTADFISVIDAKIERVNQELELNSEFKRGLLQQMIC